MKNLLAVLAFALSTGVAGLVMPAPQANAAKPPPCDFNGATPQDGATVSGVMPLAASEMWTDTTSTEFFVDGVSVGTSEKAEDFVRTYSRPGTVAGGYRTTARANGKHTINCRNFGPGGSGPMSETRTVTFDNSVRSVMNLPKDGAEVDGTTGAPPVTLRVTTTVTGTTQPTAATFYVDNVKVATGPCKSGVCEATWQPSTSARRFPFSTGEDGNENPKGGLRILHAQVTAGNGKVGYTAPTRVFVNRSDINSKLVLSEFEAAGYGRVGRDGGYSAPIPGTAESLFVMNDAKWTFNTGHQQGREGFAPGPYLATAPVKVGHPGVLSQEPNPTGHIAPAPQRADIDVTTGLTDPQGQACDARLTWATGVVASPTSNKMLITYTAMCGEPASDGSQGLRRQVEGIAEYDLTTGTATTHNILVAAPGKELDERARLGTPVRHGDHIYLYSADDQASYAARVLTTQWKTPSAYRWSTAGGFTTTRPEDATPIGSGSSTQISVGKYPNLTGAPFLKITQPTWQTVRIERSTSPTGPWESTNVTDLKLCPECQSAEGFVYTVYGHPEMSATGRVLLTYTDHAEYTLLSKEIAVS